MIDFTTALARLLRDGVLRDALAASPEALAREMDVDPADLPALCALSPEELETQADILLRKRWDVIRPFLRGSLASLPDGGWTLFRAYARGRWPESERIFAGQFARHLVTTESLNLRPEDGNRLKFVAGSTRVVGHVFRSRRLRICLQILSHRGEWRFEFGL